MDTITVNRNDITRCTHDLDHNHPDRDDWMADCYRDGNNSSNADTECSIYGNGWRAK